MAKAGKRWLALREKVDSQHRYTLDEAVGMIGSIGNTKFDETVEIAVRLGVNPRHADQMVRGAVSLPFGTGATVRVLVFAQGDAAKAAKEAGADFVGADDIVQKIQKEGWLDFDKAVATRDMMGKVGRIGRILGPRGLMPNPKVGTVVAPDQVAQTVRELKAGKIDFRVEKAGIVHAPVGRASFDAEKIHGNVVSLMHELMRLKPSSAKGTYLRSITLTTTMGVGVRIDPNDLARALSATE